MNETGKNSFVRERRFWALFGAQALGAFADNALRNATIVAVIGAAALAYGQADFTMPWGLGRLAGGISIMFTIPIFVFSAIAGQVADKLDRHELAFRLKVIELGLMIFASVCFAMGNAPLLILALFMMGTQSAFFGPVRTSLMPEYYQPNELLRANGLYNAALFIALVTGLVVGGEAMERESGKLVISTCLIIAAFMGAVFANFCPPAPAPGLKKINWNIIEVSLGMFKNAAATPGIIYPMIGIGWFWMINAASLSILPNLVTESLGYPKEVYTEFLVVACVGGGLGSIAAGILAPRLKDSLQLAGLGVAVNILASIAAFLVIISHPGGEGGFFEAANLPLILVLFIQAASNGVFAIPIMAAVQNRAPTQSRARIMATSNMTNGGMATGGAIVALVFIAIGISAEQIFVGLGALQAGLLFFMWRRKSAIRDAASEAETANPLTEEVITTSFPESAE